MRAPANGGSSRSPSYAFNIGSVDSFERALDEAQAELGVPPERRVPVTYVEEVSWGAEFARLLPPPSC